MALVASDTISTVIFDSTRSKYLVFTDGLTIETTVTNKANIVEEWIHLVLSKYAKNDMVVGLDTEWMRDQNNKLKVSILQLCVEDKCLIFQLFLMDNIPKSLRSFLSDFNFKFVGVGIEDDIRRLKNEYGLECKNGIDLATLAMRQCTNILSYRGLKHLAKKLVGLDMKRSKDVCTSEWQSRELTKDQVEHACIDAYASYKIGHKLLTEKEGVTLNSSN